MDRRKPRGQGVGPGPRPDHASVSILPVCQKRISRVRPGPVSVTAEVPSPAGCRVAGERKTREGTATGDYIKSTSRVHLGFALYGILARCFSLHALASPSRRSHVTSAPGAFGPVGRRATGTRAATLSKPLFAAMSYVGACAHPNWRTRINNTEHKRRRAHYQSIEASFFA